MLNRNQPPILIVVADGRWDSFGTLTPRSLELAQILTNLGGVSDSVPEGTYHFNAKKLVGRRYRVTLNPVKK